MGITVSKYSDISTNDLVARFCSNEIICPNDPFWNQFLAFNIQIPTNPWVIFIYIFCSHCWDKSKFSYFVNFCFLVYFISSSQKHPKYYVSHTLRNVWACWVDSSLTLFLLEYKYTNIWFLCLEIELTTSTFIVKCYAMSFCLLFFVSH